MLAIRHCASAPIPGTGQTHSPDSWILGASACKKPLQGAPYAPHSSPPWGSKTVKQPQTSSGDPTVATLLTWFVPGAGHLYLGRPLFALLAFLLVEGVFMLGLWLTDGRAFEILPQEMRSQFAPFLAPELGNLGALLFQSSRFGYGSPDPSIWPSSMHLGLALTAFGGVLNMILMSRAHFDARTPKDIPAQVAGTLRPGTAALASWAIPGLGQILQGRKWRGILMLLMLVGLFAIGTTMGEGANLDRERHFFYWGGQFFLGAPALITEAFHGHSPLDHEVPYHDLAVVMGCVAGLLNVLVMLDAYGWSESQCLGRDPKRGMTAEHGENAA